MTPLRRGGRLVATGLRADGRRPASLLAAAAAASAAVLVAACRSGGTEPVAAHAMALVAGGIVACGAIGDPPRGIAGPAAAWIVGRCLWPMLGWIGGSLTLIVAGADPRWPAASAAFAGCGLVAVAAVVAAGCRRNLPPAEATGLAMASVMASAAAAVLVPGGTIGPVPLAGMVAVVVWLAIVGGVLVRCVPHAGETEPSVATVLGAAAMMTTLGGMVAWLFLAPEHAGRYAVLVAAWFVAWAVPQVTLGWGSRDEALRRQLVTAAPAEWRTAWFHAAILGWPLLVAAVLAGDPARAAERLLVVLFVAVVAAVTATVTRLVLRSGGTRDTAQAAVLALAVVAGLGAGAARGFREKAAGNAVEQSGHTCKTPQTTPPDAAPPPCLEESFRARHRFSRQCSSRHCFRKPCVS